MRGRTTKSRWAPPGVLLVLAVVVSAIVVPFATGADGPSPSPIPQGCQLRSPQPEAPLTLNVVGAQNLAKTIAVEDEVFSCFDAKSNLAQIKTVDTTIEIAERGGVGTAPTLTTVSKSIEVETCAKDIQTGKASCKADAMSLGTTETPLAGCQPTKSTYPFDTIQQPTHPIEMGSVVLDDNLVKTVRVEKEVFDCKGRIGDVYLFTENVELAQSKDLKQMPTRFEGVVCFKDEATAKVVECKLFAPGA